MKRHAHRRLGHVVFRSNIGNACAFKTNGPNDPRRTHIELRDHTLDVSALGRIFSGLGRNDFCELVDGHMYPPPRARKASITL